MAYPLSLRFEGMLAKVESTYGTDAAPVAGTDGIRGVGRIWPAAGSEYVFENLREDTMSNSHFDVAPGIAAGRVMNLTYTVQLMGAGAAYSSSTPVRPECDPLLRCCAMSRVHVDTGGSETVTYALSDTAADEVGATVWIYAGGKLFKLVGCKGSWTWSPAAGGLGQIEFQLQGMLSVAVTEATVPSITLDTVIPPRAIAGSLAITPSGQSAWTPAADGLEVSAGVQLQRLDDVNGADGIEGFFVSGFQPTMSFTPRVVALTDYDAYTYAGSRLVHTIDYTLGSAQYNRVDLAVTLAYLMNDPTPAEVSGFAAYTPTYKLRDLSLVFD